MVYSAEINNDHFEIERSTDGNEFVKIADVQGYDRCFSANT